MVKYEQSTTPFHVATCWVRRQLYHLGIQIPCHRRQEDARSQDHGTAQRVGCAGLGVGQRYASQRGCQRNTVHLQAAPTPRPLASHYLDTHDARSLGPRLAERASSSSDQARRVLSLAHRPLPAHGRFRATLPSLFPRRPAPPCVAASPASPASPIHTGAPPGREKDRAAARLAVPSVREEGVR